MGVSVSRTGIFEYRGVRIEISVLGSIQVRPGDVEGVQRIAELVSELMGLPWDQRSVQLREDRGAIWSWSWSRIGWDGMRWDAAREWVLERLEEGARGSR